MPDQTLSQMTQASTAADSDLVYLVVGGADRSMTVANLIALIAAGVTSSTESKAFAAREEQPSGTAAGTFTSGAWRDRTINTIEQHTSSEITLSSNAMTLPAGKWILFWSAPSYATGSHQTRIVIDEAGSPEYHLGESAYVTASIGVQTASVGMAVVDQSTAFTLKLQHRCGSSRNTVGMGQATGFGVEVYGQIRGIRIGDATS